MLSTPLKAKARLVVNWYLNDVSRYARARGLKRYATGMPPEYLGHLADFVLAGVIDKHQARRLLGKLLSGELR